MDTYLEFEGQIVVIVSGRSIDKVQKALVERLRRPRIKWITIDDPKTLADRGPRAVISVSFDSRMKKNKKGGEYSSMFHKILETASEAVQGFGTESLTLWLNPLY